MLIFDLNVHDKGNMARVTASMQSLQETFPNCNLLRLGILLLEVVHKALMNFTSQKLKLNNRKLKEYISSKIAQ